MKGGKQIYMDTMTDLLSRLKRSASVDLLPVGLDVLLGFGESALHDQITVVWFPFGVISMADGIWRIMRVTSDDRRYARAPRRVSSGQSPGAICCPGARLRYPSIPSRVVHVHLRVAP